MAYPYLMDLLDEVGYEGWVGCEYRPRGRTADGLGWMARWRDAGASRAGRSAGAGGATKGQ